MKFEQIISDLKNKVYFPVYLLAGEEPYYIDEISDFIQKNILTESEKEFNQTLVYGRDTDTATVISYVKRFPMMSNYHIVIVKEAQDIKNFIPNGKEKKDERNFLEAYLENPLKSTILVICYKYGKIDKRKTFAKLVAKNGVLFESEKLYDNKVPEWITDYLKQRNYSITPKASFLLSEYVGAELSKIVNELTKITINVPPGTEIDAAHIEENIGISKDFNVFELQKAIGSRDIYKANQIVNYFADNSKDNPIVKTLSVLYGFFSKILIYHSLADKSRNNVAAALSVNPYFVNDYQTAAKNHNKNRAVKIMSDLRKYDLKSKGIDNISTAEGELLKELVYKILH